MYPLTISKRSARLLFVALTACSRSENASSAPPVAVSEAASPTSFQAKAAVADAMQGGSAAAPLPQIRDSVAPNMIIRNGAVSVQVDSLERAMAAVRALATKLGGYVGNVSVSAGQYEVRSATMELKIPASRFDEALSGISPLGKVENSSSTAEDVTEEFVDVSARVANARRLEERLIALLANRTGKLEDVLAVERELARVREEIDRYEGRIRYLKSRVATSTISVTVHEPPPLVGENPGQSVIGEAFKNMWRNFVGFIASGIEWLGVLIPAGVIFGVVVIGFKRWRRRRLPPSIS